ncbi:MAG: EAL domain-containing protein [Gammaproteobacteria bacterium]|jgi:diguanylate cyclase (GGDEF)-like protein/PAS domain S-box-containing protein|nr:EAL domain-containing protein [Gammaproteobacteria bacterium]
MIKNEQNILIVDDDPVLLRSLKELLAVHAYDTDVATGGEQAICLINKKDYDLILLDLHMPEVNGYDVMQHLKSINQKAAIIIVSGENTFEAARKACSGGTYAYLSKPYKTDELLNTVKHALKEKHLKKLNSVMQHRLKESERLHRYLVNTSPDIIYILDPQGCFTFINQRIESLLGFSPEELIGNHYSILVHQDDIQHAKYVFNERRVGERASNNIELRLKCKDSDKPRYFENKMLPIELSSMGIYTGADNNKKNTYLGTYGVARDITERKIAEETITFQAYHDLLTRLPNRTLLRDRLSLAITQAKRENEMLAVMFLDLDRFKNINDSLGHISGDELLQQVSARLKSCLRKGDTLARFGGDEFTLLLPKITNRSADARKIAEKIAYVLKEPFFIDDNELYVSASIGISLYPQDGQNMDALIKNADIAMYHVKGQGKNGFQFFSNEMDTPYYKNLSLETGIHKALDNEEFTLFFQPQINVGSGEIVGVEALLRWHHPELGCILPGEFIPFAEETGLIIEIDNWVIKNALCEISQWHQSGLPEVRMAINISACHLARENFVAEIAQALNDYNVPGRYIEIEITENAIMEDMDGVIHKLKQLRKLGISVAIDDFGTGYSSLTYLHKLPIHTLKIDRTFLQVERFANDDHTIVNTIVAMAKGLKLNVIAEGIESQRQLDYLREIGCTEAQGFLFGKPMESDLIKNLLTKKPFALPAANKPGLGLHRKQH